MLSRVPKILFVQKRHQVHPGIRSRKGFTLVELAISLSVLAIGLSTMPYAVGILGRYSADPMSQQQAILIADAYMREIIGANYLDGSTPSPFCLSSNPDKTTGRSTYDHLCDYDGTNDLPPVFPSNVDLSATVLQRYRVQVALKCPAAAGCSQTGTVTLGPSSAPVTSGTGAIPDVVEITVTVTDPANRTYVLTAYKARHPYVYTPPMGFSWFQNP